MAGEEVVGVDLHWGHFLPGPPCPFSLQAKWLGYSGLQTPASPLCFSLAPGSLGWMPSPFLPHPPHLGQACACRCCSLGLPPSWSRHSRSRGLETTNDSLLTGCWLPPACQPFPLHTADNHVKAREPPPARGHCDLNLNFALLSSSGEARFR